jgi:hypothetical protein
MLQSDRVLRSMPPRVHILPCKSSTSPRGFYPSLTVYRQYYLFESFLGCSLDEANTVNPPYVVEKKCIFEAG